MLKAGPNRDSLVIGSAGHIDHGKTALIRALTGTDTDRLPEEKRRGITIDLGFASLEAKHSTGRPLTFSFVDVPGHALFIRNMLAGTGGIDAVMLVVAADEGLKPQTREHLEICRLLGIRHGLTVLTKTDKVDAAQIETVCREVRSFLNGSFLETAPLVLASAHAGTGIAELRNALLEVADQLPPLPDGRLMRYSPDRAFVMKGVGTVVTGTLAAGEISVGEILEVQPGGHSVRVREVQTHNRRVQRAYAGSRVALNLAGIDAEQLHRGSTIVVPSTMEAIPAFDAEITLLPDPPPLRHRARVQVHAFAADIPGTIYLYGYERAEPASTRMARVRLDRPLVLVPGDRFVLRRPGQTIGGGSVLDAHPLPRLRKADALRWLTAYSDASPEEQLCARIERCHTHGATVPQLSRETGLTDESIGRLLGAPTVECRVARLASGLLLTLTAMKSARVRVESLLRTAGTQHSSWKRSELRSRTGLRAEVFDSVLTTLCEEKRIRLSAELVLPYTPDAHLAAQDEERISKVCAIYEAAGLASPLSSEVAARLSLSMAQMRSLITLLQRQKRLIRMGSDTLYIHHAAVERLRGELQKLRGQSLDVARFKELTGLSRKHAIPLLEYLDGERVTRRVGEQRLVV